MPRRELVLCRGFRGVHSFTARKLRQLREADSFAPARSLVVAPTAAAAHLLRGELEDAVFVRSGPGSAALLPTTATPATFLPLLIEEASPELRIADPLLREALLESAFSKVQEAGIAPPFHLRGGLARRVLELTDEILAKAPFERSTSGLDRFVARALDELEAPDDEGALKLAAQTRFLQVSVAEYRARLEEMGLADAASARLALSGRKLPFEQVFVLGGETLALADLDLLSTAPLDLTIAMSGDEDPFPEGLRSRFSVLKAKGDPDSAPRLLTPHAENEMVFLSRDREEAFTDVARLLKTLSDDGRLPPLHRIGVVVPRPLTYLYLAKKVFTEAG
ncbi:MAG TPA: hypothetical protein VIG29_20915, partial [Vicinamibacteria bacterium]